MSEPSLLKDSFGPDVPARIGQMIASADAGFNQRKFVSDCLVGYEELELMARGRHIAQAMAKHLPSDPAEAVSVLLHSLPSEAEAAGWSGMAGFILMPHGVFVANHGLVCFEESMQLQYEITKRFTSEFSIRAFIASDYERTMARLAIWARDPNEHVRRLVSEGTRPRLPWAPRLPMFMADPSPVVELLEALKDDRSSYVRRSVANNLNDIAKDNPDVTLALARRWWDQTDSAQRHALLRHGLRTLIKAGNPDALAVMGYAKNDDLALSGFAADPPTARIGGSTRISVTVANESDKPARALIDLVIDFVKANGSVSSKVFKGVEVELGAGDSTLVKKTISLRQHTTRTHYPGIHPVSVLVNGVAHTVGSFDLRA